MQNCGVATNPRMPLHKHWFTRRQMTGVEQWPVRLRNVCGKFIIDHMYDDGWTTKSYAQLKFTLMHKWPSRITICLHAGSQWLKAKASEHLVPLNVVVVWELYPKRKVSYNPVNVSPQTLPPMMILFTEKNSSKYLACTPQDHRNVATNRSHCSVQRPFLLLWCSLFWVAPQSASLRIWRVSLSSLLDCHFFKQPIPLSYPIIHQDLLRP